MDQLPMTTDGRKPGWAFWTIVLLVVLIAYLVSFGAVFLFDRHVGIPEWAGPPLQVVYWPLIAILKDGAEPLRDSLRWYVKLWNPDVTF